MFYFLLYMDQVNDQFKQDDMLKQYQRKVYNKTILEKSIQSITENCTYLPKGT